MANREEHGLCSIVILSYNQVNYTRNCLDSIRKYTCNPYEIIVIDNASNQETVAYLEEQKDIVLVENKENLGFAGGCNQGIELAKGEYIMLLNNDTIVTANWLENMMDLLVFDEKIAMVGPLTNSTVGKQMIQVPYGDDLDKMQAFALELSKSGARPWKTLRLVAFCLLARKSLFDEIGMLDEGFQIGNYEDDDFCIRALLAEKTFYVCRTSFIQHFMNISFKENNLPRERIMQTNKLRLEAKWDHMNWNHHSVVNTWMLSHILESKGNKVFHIGCGLGALAIELKDNNPNYYVVGIEDHPIRRKIAQGFLDSVYDWDDQGVCLQSLQGEQFDTIVVECMLEKTGIQLLDKIKQYLAPNGQVLLRIFNNRHITTLERLLTSQVGGDLLCASSPEFTYYFDKGVEARITEDLDYEIIDLLEVKKSFSIIQDELAQMTLSYPDFAKENSVYNRIYQLKRMR